MAKKSDAATVSSSNSWLTASGYSLTLKNSDTKFAFNLDVPDEKNAQYYLQVLQLNESTGLIQRVLRVIADRWPAYDWQFQADTNGKITDVR